MFSNSLKMIKIDRNKLYLHQIARKNVILTFVYLLALL